MRERWGSGVSPFPFQPKERISHFCAYAYISTPSEKKRKEPLNWLHWDFYVSEECSIGSKLYAIPDGRNAYLLTTKTIVLKLQCLIRVPTLNPAANTFIFTEQCAVLAFPWVCVLFLNKSSLVATHLKYTFIIYKFLAIFSFISFSSFPSSSQKGLAPFLFFSMQMYQFHMSFIWLFKRFHSAEAFELDLLQIWLFFLHRTFPPLH